MLESGQPMSELASQIPQYYIEKRKMGTGVRNLKSMEQNMKKLKKNGRVDRSDGVKIDWGDSWLHVRPSGTEPVIRIIAEAKTRQKAKVIANEAARLMGEL
jgi:phosphomannomutase